MAVTGVKMKKTIVIKYGGSILHDKQKQKAFFKELSDLYQQHNVVLVHGGGTEITDYCEKLNIQTVFHQGRRVTNADTLEIVQMILFGKINRELICLLNQFDIQAVGLTGQDAAMIQVKQKKSELGFVGEIQYCDPTILQHLLEKNYLPVIAPIAIDQYGQSYNVNADEVAASIAISLLADELIFMTDVAGVYLDKTNPATLISNLKINDLKQLIAKKIISDGMIPKLESSLDAVEKGVGKVWIGKTMIVPHCTSPVVGESLPRICCGVDVA